MSYLNFCFQAISSFFLCKKYFLFIFFRHDIGVGMVMRKMGNSVSPTVELVKDGDEYSFNTTSTFKSTTIKFKLGEEFDEETLDGRKVKSTMTLEGNKLIQDQKGDKAHQIIREFTDTDLTAVSCPSALVDLDHN